MLVKIDDVLGQGPVPAYLADHGGQGSSERCQEQDRRKRTDAGYFYSAHWANLADHAVRLSNSGAAVYIPINTVDPQLIGRFNNRMQDFATATTTDHQIVKRRWLLIDLDPVRPTLTSATDLQLEAAHLKARSIFVHLKTIGWADPVVGLSGTKACCTQDAVATSATMIRREVKGWVVMKDPFMRLMKTATQLSGCQLRQNLNFTSLSSSGRVSKCVKKIESGRIVEGDGHSQATLTLGSVNFQIGLMQVCNRLDNGQYQTTAPPAVPASR